MLGAGHIWETEVSGQHSHLQGASPVEPEPARREQNQTRRRKRYEEAAEAEQEGGRSVETGILCHFV